MRKSVWFEHCRYETKEILCEGASAGTVPDPKFKMYGNANDRLALRKLAAGVLVARETASFGDNYIVLYEKVPED